MPIALFIKRKYRNLAHIFDQKSALEGIFLLGGGRKIEQYHALALRFFVAAL
jgi:hypothetical protein